MRQARKIILGIFRRDTAGDRERMSRPHAGAQFHDIILIRSYAGSAPARRGNEAELERLSRSEHGVGFMPLMLERNADKDEMAVVLRFDIANALGFGPGAIETVGQLVVSPGHIETQIDIRIDSLSRLDAKIIDTDKLVGMLCFDLARYQRQEMVLAFHMNEKDAVAAGAECDRRIALRLLVTLIMNDGDDSGFHDANFLSKDLN